MENEEVKEEIVNGVQEADVVAKILCAIMNEEDDVEEYLDKTSEELVDILKMISARYPNNNQASYDPAYTKFGQVVMNGFNTFGIDFLKVLNKRRDDISSLCIKGLIDMYTNMLVQNQILALNQLPEEERIKIMKDLSNAENMSDEEFVDSLEKLSEEDK